MLGSLIALYVAVVAEALVYILALHRMVRFELSRERAEEILGRCGIKTSRVIPRRE